MPTSWVAELAINRSAGLDDVANKPGDVVDSRVSPLSKLSFMLCPYVADTKPSIWSDVTPDTQEDVASGDHVSA
ncbi:hypothetical protein R1141_004649 [Salmonella enterica]|uniref:hypothetical protein n=1 Tax=Enterobacteriaceae TaxID=543 RepID=UPI0017CF9353|nr:MULTISPECIES: hypothetical protein [Enterobacteriaceae]EDZ3519328.1 hypothetical protein [Salmonella enterica]EEF5382419.1 hypothetical protein [Salmonella enterica subsp. enterica serovar Braenderup]EFA9605885.1 hypothetical protein [Escherichia coli]EHE2088295.1 hypothetical protein [Salmonella enterica subsp. enterica serovar Havana]HDC4774332.1 hypothetical protein [Enterobacter cloacae]